MRPVRSIPAVQLFMDQVEVRRPEAPRLVAAHKVMTAFEADEWAAMIDQARVVISERALPCDRADVARQVLKRMAVDCTGHAVFGPRGPGNPFTRLMGLSLTVAGSLIPTCHYAELSQICDQCERLIALWREGNL